MLVVQNLVVHTLGFVDLSLGVLVESVLIVVVVPYVVSCSPTGTSESYSG